MKRWLAELLITKAVEIVGGWVERRRERRGNIRTADVNQEADAQTAPKPDIPERLE